MSLLFASMPAISAGGQSPQMNSPKKIPQVPLLVISASENGSLGAIQGGEKMKFSKQLTALLVLSVTLLTGCTTQSESASTPTPITSQSEEPIPSQEIANPWECEREQDGLGDKFSCQSRTTDSYGTYWILTLLCTSDGQSKHSVYGMDSGANTIFWPTGTGVAKVRIDSGPIKEWTTASKGNDDGGFAFKGFGGKSKGENAATWELLTKIASAESFGFQAFDSQKFSQSARFDVQGSVPIAATFSAMGCSN